MKKILKGVGLGLIVCNMLTVMVLGPDSLKFHGAVQVTLVALGGICYIAGVFLP